MEREIKNYATPTVQLPRLFFSRGGGPFVFKAWAKRLKTLVRIYLLFLSPLQAGVAVSSIETHPFAKVC